MRKFKIWFDMPGNRVPPGLEPEAYKSRCTNYELAANSKEEAIYLFRGFVPLAHIILIEEISKPSAEQLAIYDLVNYVWNVRGNFPDDELTEKLIAYQELLTEEQQKQLREEWEES